jgi:hypothetical protein
MKGLVKRNNILNPNKKELCDIFHNPFKDNVDWGNKAAAKKLIQSSS